MARAGVNYIHVAKAAEAIKERGLEPTVDRVREQLGTGRHRPITTILKPQPPQTPNANKKTQKKKHNKQQTTHSKTKTHTKKKGTKPTTTPNTTNTKRNKQTNT